jgi:hypothetical protein
VSTEETRDQFMLMAQVWLRLAEDQDPRPFGGADGEPPSAVQQQQQQQQQQQPQPEDDADGS